MVRCKNCRAYLDPGEICDCVRSQEERAAMKEAMFALSEYLNASSEVEEDDVEIEVLNKAFKIVFTEIAEKYGYEPKKFIGKVIDALEEVADEVE